MLLKTCLGLALILGIGAGQPTPVAVARLCGNTVVQGRDLRQAKASIRAEGCDEIRIIKLDVDWYLIYGVRVLTGEGAKQEIYKTRHY